MATDCLELLHHLDTNYAAVIGELDAVEEIPAEEPKVTVDILHIEAEQHPHQELINPPQDDSILRIRAADLVSINDVDVRSHCRQERGEFLYIILAVSVRVEDQFLRAVCKTGDQCGAVASVDAVMDHSREGVVLRQAV